MKATKVKQGQTWYLVVDYSPGTFLDNPDTWLCLVYSVRILSVKGTTVHYELDTGIRYFCGKAKFYTLMTRTKKKAIRKANQIISDVNWKIISTINERLP